MVVQLDVVVLGWVGMGEELVNNDVAQWAGPVAVCLAGRTADGVANIPGTRVFFTVSGTGQNQRASCAICGNWPGINVGVRDREKYRANFVEQLKCIRFL